MPGTNPELLPLGASPVLRFGRHVQMDFLMLARFWGVMLRLVIELKVGNRRSTGGAIKTPTPWHQARYHHRLERRGIWWGRPDAVRYESEAGRHLPE